jgi:hypothetical protein
MASAMDARGGKMTKYKCTVVMVAEVEVEVDEEEMNDYDVQDNLRWSAECGYMDFNSKLVDDYATLRAQDAIVTVVEVE